MKTDLLEFRRIYSAPDISVIAIKGSYAFLQGSKTTPGGLNDMDDPIDIYDEDF